MRVDSRCLTLVMLTLTRGRVTLSLWMCSDMETIRLYTDELLDDDSKVLSECGVEHMSVIQLALRVDGGLTV